MIEHKGVIQEICADYIKVTIEKKDACANCHSKDFCSLSSSTNKVVEIRKTNSPYRVGEEVTVIMEQSSGYKAVLLGYIVPFFIILIFLFTLLQITHQEALSAAIAIIAIVPYYLGLYLLRNKLKKIFSLKLKQ
jgi:sigma-E factor negative regulatory protein RseC